RSHQAQCTLPDLKERAVTKLAQIIVLSVLDRPDFPLVAVLDFRNGVVQVSATPADRCPEASAGIIGSGAEADLNRYVDIICNQHGLLDSRVQVGGRY